MEYYTFWIHFIKATPLNLSYSSAILCYISLASKNCFYSISLFRICHRWSNHLKVSFGLLSDCQDLEMCGILLKSIERRRQRRKARRRQKKAKKAAKEERNQRKVSCEEKAPLLLSNMQRAKEGGWDISTDYAEVDI